MGWTGQGPKSEPAAERNDKSGGRALRILLRRHRQEAHPHGLHLHGLRIQCVQCVCCVECGSNSALKPVGLQSTAVMLSNNACDELG